MYGVFKKLTANDIKITPFEAHKQYSIIGSANFASSGIVTGSLYWSPNNKSTFSSESIKYFQMDKLYYRDFIHNRAHRLELDDAPYKKQERRLYETASVISIPQYTFGNEIQPESVTIRTDRGTTFKDDGLGNLYNISRPPSSFPDEDNRVLYIAPVKAFKYKNLNINPETGNTVVNPPTYFNGVFYDDSYFKNSVTYKNILFESGGFDFPNTGPVKVGTPSIVNATTSSRIEIENRPYLNFNNDDFAISFWLYHSSNIVSFRDESDVGDRLYILTKEGAINTPTNVVENDISSNVNSTQPGTSRYPYKIWLEKLHAGSVTLNFERSDGNNTSLLTTSNILTVGLSDEFVHYTLQKSGSELQAWQNGLTMGVHTQDNTVESCENKSNILIFSKRNNNSSYDDNGYSFPLQQLIIWDTALSETEIYNVCYSFTGTPYVGNVFYDNGFCTITHPSIPEEDIHPISRVIYKNSYPITEYEYQCTVSEQEYNYTNNLSVRKVPTIENDEYKSYVTGSNFKPYVTTIGLYDDNNNLLAVGKLGQPIKMTDETDTTFVIRFDI